MSEAKREAIIQEASRFMVELAMEGDRSAVVLGAARLDVALEHLLKSVMHRDTGGKDNMFDPDRPLSTFSAKIALAHRLNLIDSDFEHALQMVRKIRNDFAHSTEKLTLQEPRHKSRLQELSTCTGKASTRLHSDLCEVLAKTAKRSQALTEFSASITVLLTVLEVLRLHTEPISPKYIGKLDETVFKQFPFFKAGK